MNNLFTSIGMVMIFTGPAYLLPVTIGPIILSLYKHKLGKLAGWFTLKPLLATPLWVLMAALVDDLNLPKDLKAAISLLPAVLLTLLIALRFRGVFKAERVAFVFLAADALRWLNTFAWSHFGGRAELTDPFFLAGWILPNAYAVMALVILGTRIGQSTNENQSNHPDPTLV